ncbi:hypothetical protein B0H65DRAFT_168624 [Neurospora tetraspora]|uniref:Uncharacterized protein n=1 Tax=Neurospora tetraspora TaxID=94610 RepID=A0AAE0JIB5_9PEZI|nr:hypothetical protein B0H65DRAFT_168624 [Neurospora tetraspora]
MSKLLNGLLREQHHQNQHGLGPGFGHGHGHPHSSEFHGPNRDHMISAKAATLILRGVIATGPDPSSAFRTSSSPTSGGPSPTTSRPNTSSGHHPTSSQLFALSSQKQRHDQYRVQAQGQQQQHAAAEYEYDDDDDQYNDDDEAPTSADSSFSSTHGSVVVGGGSFCSRDWFDARQPSAAAVAAATASFASSSTTTRPSSSSSLSLQQSPSVPFDGVPRSMVAAGVGGVGGVGGGRESVRGVMHHHQIHHHHQHSKSVPVLMSMKDQYSRMAMMQNARNKGSRGYLDVVDDEGGCEDERGFAMPNSKRARRG